ncbi:unnamed protein product [Enterobius vermicularis]|uniref:CYSTM domain-containing protein n=1 Tax=Enterobius vermicularis TaxID=51028 RepID=A0A0N4UZ17_ENTVE|nr:unnamed protein product [Enterobius vermicularis]
MYYPFKNYSTSPVVQQPGFSSANANYASAPAPGYSQGGFCYPQGAYYPASQPPVVVYRERESDLGCCNWCLASLAALFCGCLIGECTDSNVLCCLLPCPPFRCRW